MPDRKDDQAGRQQPRWSKPPTAQTDAPCSDCRTRERANRGQAIPATSDKLGQSVTLPNDSTPGTVAMEDYDVWRANFGQSGGPTGPSALFTGVVRYVTAGSSAAVPETSTILLIGIGLAGCAVWPWRRI